MPLTAVVAVLVGALALANLIAVVPSAMAGRLRAAEALRSE